MKEMDSLEADSSLEVGFVLGSRFVYTPLSYSRRRNHNS